MKIIKYEQNEYTERVFVEGFKNLARYKSENNKTDNLNRSLK